MAALLDLCLLNMDLQTGDHEQCEELSGGQSFFADCCCRPTLKMCLFSNVRVCVQGLKSVLQGFWTITVSPCGNKFLLSTVVALLYAEDL